MKMITSYRQFGLIVSLAILLIIASIITPNMFTSESLLSMLRNNSVFALLAVGMMLVLITGGIDLSVASTLSLTGVITSMLMSENQSVPSFVWVLFAIFVGGICGLINGFLIGKLKMVPMIATLGTMYIYRGLAFLMSKGEWLFPHQFTVGYVALADKKFFGLYSIIWIAIITLIIAGIFLGYTTTGRRIYTIGTSLESAKIAGVKESNVKIVAYTLGGILAGIAGILYTANYSICFYGMGEGFEMQAIAICILGGVSISGGRGRIDGVAIGFVIMSLITYFISMLPGLSVWQEAIQGAIIIATVMLNIYIGKLEMKRALKERGALI